MSDQEIKQTIESRLKTLSAKKGRIEIAFFGGSFTALPIKQMIAYLDLVYPYIHSGLIHNIRLSTRPDYVNEEILEILKKYKVRTIELGAQSMSDDVLKKSGRGHTADDTRRASAMIIENGFRLGLQMMTGLPGDTFETSLNTAREFVNMGANETRIYPTLVIEGTKLAEMYRKVEYTPPASDETISLLCRLIKIFEDAGVIILRIGLHPTEETGIAGIIAGPEQTALREKALTELWWEELKQLLCESGRAIKIFVKPTQLNYAAGYRKSNRSKLEKHFYKVSFHPDNNLNGREFYTHFN